MQELEASGALAFEPDHDEPAPFFTFAQVLADWRKNVSEYQRHQFRYGCEDDHVSATRAWWLKHFQQLELRIAELTGVLYANGWTGDDFATEWSGGRVLIRLLALLLTLGGVEHLDARGTCEPPPIAPVCEAEGG